MKQLLTGKCREDFEEFLLEFFNNKEKKSNIAAKLQSLSFHSSPLSMQWGVIQDFADSVGINITLYQMDWQAWYGYYIVKFGKPVITGGVWRRDKAREEAIKQFNNVYNENQDKQSTT